MGIFSTFLILFPILLRPSLFEFFILIVADSLAFMVTQMVDQRIYLKLNPKAALFFPDIKTDAIQVLNEEQKLDFFNSLAEFPKKRARYVATMTYFKVIPAFVVILFFFKYDIPLWLQAFKAAGITLTINAYFYGAVFIESHDLASRLIADLHLKFDFQRVFRQTNLSYNRKDFETQERLAILSIWTFMTILQWGVVSNHNANGPVSLSSQVVAIGLVGLTLISRIWYLGRRYFFGGLEGLFRFFEDFDPSRVRNNLPLHSASILSHFERIINSLLDRLRAYEAELTQWIFKQTEEGRYRALGEVSALVVHDLSAPLHVIHFCTEQLKESPDLIRDPRYLENLAVNGARSLELINSLKAYLKDPKSKRQEVSTCFEDAHRHVMRLLETRFSMQGFNQIMIKLDPRLGQIHLKITSADLIHVLLNLYSNSIENLLNHSISDPEIRVNSADGPLQSVAEIKIYDNGTGLCPEKYEHLTGLMFFQGSSADKRSSLGLRLIRRLVEGNQGTLVVLQQPPEARGTLFSLKLNVAPLPQ